MPMQRGADAPVPPAGLQLERPAPPLPGLSYCGGLTYCGADEWRDICGADAWR